MSNHFHSRSFTGMLHTSNSLTNESITSLHSSKDAQVLVWDRETLTLHRTFRGHEGPVNALGLQGDKVVSASGDGKMMLWDISSGERQRTFEGHDRGLACIEFKDDIIVSGSNDCKIKVWKASTGECIRTLTGHESLVRALSFDSRSGRLVSGSYDRSVKVWNLNTGKLVREFRGCHSSHIFDVRFDSSRIVRFVLIVSRLFSLNLVADDISTFQYLPRPEDRRPRLHRRSRYHSSRLTMIYTFIMRHEALKLRISSGYDIYIPLHL